MFLLEVIGKFPEEYVMTEFGRKVLPEARKRIGQEQ